jgi:hypothetical protein
MFPLYRFRRTAANLAEGSEALNIHPLQSDFFKRNRVLELPFWLCGRLPAIYEVTCDASIGALVGHSQMVVTFQ